MAALTVQTVPVAGVVVAPTAVAASDTIDGDQIPAGGVILRVINGGGSTDNVSVSDGGSTPAGNPGTVTPVAVAAGATKSIKITRNNIVVATDLVTITHSFTTSVTCEVQA